MGRQSKFEHHKDAVLKAIDTLTRREGKAPSMRQIAAETDVSVATLHAYLKKLRTEGHIEWVEGKHRSIRLSKGALAAVGQGSTPPPPPAPAPVSVPVAAPSTPVAPVIPIRPRVVDETVDVGF